MRGPIRSILLAALAVCAFAAIPAVQVSAATIETSTGAFQAIYGSPGTNGATLPVGGGLGHSFGFGENVMFQACSGCTTAVGESLEITVLGSTYEPAKDLYLGGTLASNKTGANNPLSVKIDFVDTQDGTLGGAGAPFYADTTDRPWITEICSPAAVGTSCKTDAQYAQGNKPGGVKIENVSLSEATAGGPIVYQGALWGTWINGAAGKAPCIKFETPAGGNPTLVVTQAFTGGPAIGTPITAVSGKACLISANNDWYSVKAGESKEPAVTIANT